MNAVSFPLLACCLLIAPAQETDDVSRWVHEFVEVSLDYHCRSKFGDNERTFTSNPDKLAEKWERLLPLLRQAEQSTLPRGWQRQPAARQLNADLLRYCRKLRQWELWLRRSKEDFASKLDYYLLRLTLETVAGEDAEAVYDAMPDDLEAKQDLLGVVGAGVNRQLKNGEMQYALERMRTDLITRLRTLGDPQADLVAEDLERLGKRPEFEQQWLKENRPGLLDRSFVESRKQLFQLQEAVRSRLSNEKLAQINACPQLVCRQFMANYQLAKDYEDRNLPLLAIPPTQRWTKLLDSAYQEALQWSAQSGNTQGSLADELLELLLTTHDVYRPSRSSGGEPFDYVRPTDIETLQKQAQLAQSRDPSFGFVGMIDAVEQVKSLEVLGDTLVVLGDTGLATYDLKTGSRQHLLYELPPDRKVESMAVDAKNQWVYVVTDAPSVVRFNLQSGKLDPGFKSPEISRKDAKIAISPSGKTLAVGMFGKIQLYDVGSGSERGQFRSQLNLLIYGLRFGEAGQTLLVHGNGPNNYEYNLRNGEQVHERRIVADKTNAYNYAIRCSHGMVVAGGLGAVAAWPQNSSTPKAQIRFTGDRGDIQCRWAEVTPTGSHLVSSHGIWDLENSKQLVRFVPQWNAEAMALTATANRLAIGHDKTVFVVPTCLSTRNEAAPPQAQMRTWTDRSGKFSIEAELVKISGDKVLLRKSDGSTLAVAIEALSADDQKHLTASQPDRPDK